MGFLNTIKYSVYSSSFYQGIPQKSFVNTLGYFLLLGIIIVSLQVISWVGPWGVIGSELQDMLSQTGTIDCYPEELEITVRNGEVFTNVKEPYFIKDCREGADPSRNIVVIDTKTSFSLSQLEQYWPAVWITKDAIVSYSKDARKESKLQSFRFNDYSFLRNATINKNKLDELFHRFSSFLNQPLISIILFPVLFLGYIARLVYLLPLAIIIWLTAKVLKKDFSYGPSYKAGIHAMTLAFFVELVLTFTAKWTHFTGFPFMFSIITLAVIIINFATMKSLSVRSDSLPTSPLSTS